MSKIFLTTIVIILLAFLCVAVPACQPTMTAPNSPTPKATPDLARMPEPARPPLETPSPLVPTAPIQQPSSTVTAAPTSTVSVEELKHKLESGDSIMLVDVRTKASFDSGHINGAV